MTKQELEAAVERLQQVNTERYKRIVELEKKIEEQQQAFFKQAEDIEAAFEEKRYQEWKSQNGKFAERFFRELIEQNLSVETTTDYGGEVETSLYYGDKQISHSSDTVNTYRNPLDE